MAKIGFSEKGLVMPHNKELEQNIIFSVLKDSTETFDIIAGFFKSDAFYYPDYKIIYDCAYAMYNQNMTVDLFTIATELEKEKKLAQIGGLPELLNLSNMFVTNANIEYYARIVMEKYIKRYLISLGNDLNVNGYDSSLSAFDVIEKIEKEINELVEIGSKDYEKIDPYNDVFEEIRNSIQNRIDGIKTGIPSGFKELDAMTGGWQKSDLIVVGGRPGIGKTGVALAFAINAIKNNKKTAFFSLEMSSSQILKRFISFDTLIPLKNIIQGNLSTDELSVITDSITRIKNKNLYINDTSALNIFDFKRICKKLKKEEGIDLIVVDYLQLMTLSKEDKKSKRNEEVGFISRTLKAIAKELNLPIIALAQLNRGVENKGKGNRKPQMSDLAESGNIEQDADLILFVHREEYYDPEAMTAEGVSLKGKGELILRKHRNGEVGDVYVNFDGTTVRYFDDHSIDSTSVHTVIDYNSRFEKDFTDEF